MVDTHRLSDDLGALGVLLVVLEAHLAHGVEHAAMDGLQAVASIGECAPDDDGHRVVEIRAAHLLFDIDRDETAFAGWRTAIEGELGVLFVGHRGFHPSERRQKKYRECWAGNLAGYNSILRFADGFPQAGDKDLSF